MKKFYFTAEMLGNKKSVAQLMARIPRKDMAKLEKLAGSDAKEADNLHKFFCFFSIVPSSIRKNKGDRITSTSARYAYVYASRIQKPVPRTLQDKIDALEALLPKIEALGLIQDYINSDARRYLYYRSEESHFLEATSSLLASLEGFRNTMTDDDFSDVMKALRTSLKKMLTAVLKHRRFLFAPRTELNDYDKAVLEALVPVFNGTPIPDDSR